MAIVRARIETPPRTWPPAATLAFGLSFAVLLLVYWRRLLMGGLLPVDGNMLTLSFPNWSVGRRLWASGLPLWNPWRDLGEPFAADPQTMAFYPPQIILMGLGDFHVYLGVWVALHTFLASWFAARLAYRVHGSPAAAAAAALAAAFNGFLTARVTFPNHFASASWLPAVLYAQSAGSVPGLALALAMQWLAGFPPFSILTGLAAAFIAFGQGRKGLKTLVLGGAASVSLAAVQVLPFLELLFHSARPAVLGAGQAVAYSVPPLQLLKEVLLPQWYGLRPMVEGDPAIVSFYMGPFALALAAWGIYKGGSLERRAAIGAAAALALSLGGFLPFYGSLAPLRLFRFPANWLLLATAALGALACAGAAALPRRAAWAAVGLLALDLVAFGQYGRSAWSRPGLLTDVPGLASKLAALGPYARLYHAPEVRDAWSRAWLSSEADYLVLKDYLAPSYGTAFGVGEVSSYQVLAPRRSADFARRAAEAGPASPLLDWAGVGALVTSNPEGGAEAPFKAWLRPPAEGRLFIIPPAAAKVESLRYRPGTAQAAVSAAGPCAAVFAETLYPGWRAEVDGRPASYGAFEDVFPSLELTPGVHKIEFIFLPASFLAGLALTLVAAAALAAASGSLERLAARGRN